MTDATGSPDHDLVSFVGQIVLATIAADHYAGPCIELAIGAVNHRRYCGAYDLSFQATMFVFPVGGWMPPPDSVITCRRLTATIEHGEDQYQYDRVGVLTLQEVCRGHRGRQIQEHDDRPGP